MTRVSIDDLVEEKEISGEEMKAVFGGLQRPNLGRPGTGQGMPKLFQSRTGQRYLGRQEKREAPHVGGITTWDSGDPNDPDF